jgi:multimeric flavodoxin WrbA
MDKGNTALILTPFLNGMKEAGAGVELFYTKKLEINPCQGCFGCWVKTPGRCVQEDDIQIVHSKLREADVYVFATPVYYDGMTSPMKNLLDRMIPLLEPFIELRDGHCRHPRRREVRSAKAVLVSSCGLWEVDNFDPLLFHIKAFCKNAACEFAGALLRPHSGVIKPMMKMEAPINDIFEATKEAGRQLVAGGKMSPETLSITSRELIPLEAFIQNLNERFRQTLDTLEKE